MIGHFTLCVLIAVSLAQAQFQGGGNQFHPGSGFQDHGHQQGGSHEHPEMGSMTFYYEPSSHYMVARTTNNCYVMSLSADQQKTVHNNLGLENLEITMMAMIHGGEDTLDHDALLKHDFNLERLCDHHIFYKVGDVVTKTTTTAMP